VAKPTNVYQSLLVYLGFEYDKDGLNKMKTATKAAQKTTLGVAEAITAMGAAAAASAAALGYLTVKMAKTSSEAIKMARSLGMSYEQFQNIISAGTVLGVTSDEATLSLRNLSKVMGEASRGTGEGVVAFSRLHIKLSELRGKLKDPTAMILEISERMKGLQKAEQLDIGTKLGFNRRSIRLIQQGRYSLTELMKDRKAFGVESKEGALQNEHFVYQIERMKWAFTSLLRPVTEVTAYLVTEFIEPWLDFIRDNPEQMKKWQNKIAYTVGYMSGLFKKFANSIGLSTEEAVLGVTALVTAIGGLTGVATLSKLTGLGKVISLAFKPMLAAAAALAGWKAGSEVMASSGGALGAKFARGEVSGYGKGEKAELGKQWDQLDWTEKAKGYASYGIGIPANWLGRMMYGKMTPTDSESFAPTTQAAAASGGGGATSVTVNVDQSGVSTEADSSGVQRNWGVLGEKIADTCESFISGGE